MSKEAWKIFFSLEEDFLRHVRENCFDLYSSSQDELKYIEYVLDGVEYKHPPRYIRSIQYSDDIDSLEKNWLSIVGAYQQAFEEANGKEKPVTLPKRFPVFIRNADSIRYSENDAYKSLRVDRDSKERTVVLKTYNALDEHEVLLAQQDLQSILILFPSACLEQPVRGWTIYLMVDKWELLGFFQCDRLQFRIKTGTQYTARVLLTNGTVERYALGFLILDGKVPLEHSLSRKSRRDAYREQDNLASMLPIDMRFEIYKRD